MQSCTLLAAVSVVTAVVVFLWARSFDAPNGSWFYSEAANWQKWIFVIWTVAGPLLLLWDWYVFGSNLEGTKLTQFQYRQKLIGDLWSAGAVMFGVFWGLKKLPSLMAAAPAGNAAAQRTVEPAPMVLPPKAEAISARIIPWDDEVGIGVAYDFHGGKHQAHAIADDDWPVIRRLEQEGRLTYTNDTVRRLVARRIGE